MKTVTLTILLLILAGVAGCASPDSGDDMTPTTSTPVTTPAVTPTTTPMMTPMTPAMPELPDCPMPAAPDATPSNATSLVFTVTEPTPTDPCYAVHGPTSAPSGWLNVTFQNTGREPHHITFLKLGNMSFVDYRAQALGMTMDMHNMSADKPTPFGGPQAGPMGNTTALLYLAPGEYAVVCFVPGMNGLPHVMGGMMARFLVSNETSDLTEPVADITLDLQDYRFNWSANVTSGMHIVKVMNSGPHHHEAVLAGLAGNATSTDFLAAFSPDAQGPPPLTAMSGLAGMGADQHAYFWVDITPGNWALLCFEQDSSEAPPHFVLGMVKDFVVS